MIGIDDKDRMVELSAFFSDDGSREAYVLWDRYKKKYCVQMMINDGKNFTVKEMRSMGIHNERYGEDCAENWVSGIINE